MGRFSLFVVFIAAGRGFVFGQLQEENLFKIFEGKWDEPGVKSGYVTINGDTAIPLGKYYYCFTDTMQNFAIVWKYDGRIIGINSADKELFEVFKFDNGPDYVSDGMFRIIKDGKIGFANSEGEIKIQPQFDCAFPFVQGKAKVSNNCIPEKLGEHSGWESAQWYYVDKSGNKIDP